MQVNDVGILEFLSFGNVGSGIGYRNLKQMAAAQQIA